MLYTSVYIHRTPGYQSGVYTKFECFPSSEGLVEEHRRSKYWKPISLSIGGVVHEAFQEVKYKWSQRRGDYVHYANYIDVISHSPIDASKPIIIAHR